MPRACSGEGPGPPGQAGGPGETAYPWPALGENQGRRVDVTTPMCSSDPDRQACSARTPRTRAVFRPRTGTCGVIHSPHRGTGRPVVLRSTMCPMPGPVGTAAAHRICTRIVEPLTPFLSACRTCGNCSAVVIFTLWFSTVLSTGKAPDFPHNTQGCGPNLWITCRVRPRRENPVRRPSSSRCALRAPPGWR